MKYGTRSIVHFEALEQTLRLRLFAGTVDYYDKYFLFVARRALTRTVLSQSVYSSRVYACVCV